MPSAPVAPMHCVNAQITRKRLKAFTRGRYKTQVTGHRSQVTGHRLHVTGYRAQVTGHRAQVTENAVKTVKTLH